MPSVVAADLYVAKDGREKDHIEVTFRFNPVWVSAMKSIPGVSFKKANQTKCGGPAWHVPADLTTAKLLREKFGEDLKLSPDLRRWGRAKANRGRTLSRLALADTAKLTRLPGKLPPLHEALYVGPRGSSMTNTEFNEALAQPEGSFQLADVAFMAHALGTHGVNCVNANQPGMGKGSPRGTFVLTPGGWKTIEILEVGESIIDSSGNRSKVTGVFPRGYLETYQVSFNDGSSVVVDGDHLWIARTKNMQLGTGKYRIKKTTDLKDDLGNGLKWRIPLVQPVQFSAADSLTIDPYLMGVLIADGSLRQGAIFSCGDDLVPKEVEKVLAKDYYLSKSGDGWRVCTSPTNATNPISKEIVDLKLNVYSHERFIPKKYLLASVEDRISLLQGLMDTDGEVHKSQSSLAYSTSSERLKDDFLFLVRSLGGVARVRYKEDVWYTVAGVRKKGRPGWGIHAIALPENITPTRALSCRAIARTKYPPRRVMRSITPVGKREVFCISVDSPDRSYVTEDFIVTHNTLETIGAVFESGRDEGPNLIIAPVTSLDVVWKYELERWQCHPVIIANEHQGIRKEAVREALRLTAAGEPFWFICSPGMVQYRTRKIISASGDETKEEYILYPEVFDIEWSTVTLDEFHKMGLGNPATLTAKAISKLKVKGKAGLSGTPLGGNPIKLYGILHWLDPKEFSSKWTFASQWLVVDETTWMKRGEEHHGKKIGGIREEKREEFDIMLSQYLTRRTKEECLPWLPPKQFVDIWAEADSRQKKQYDQFALDAEIRIDDENLSAPSILAEYTRLKQFADAEQSIAGTDPKTGKPIVVPTFNSCKLPHVMQLLDERGIRKEDPEGEDQVVIFSQFSKMVDMVCDHLNLHKIPAEKITGEVTGKKRAEMVRNFQASKIRVAVITTTAGGVSITLDKANTVIVLDETWNPDDQEQAVDRVHRGAKTKQVIVYTIRTKGTIEQYIQSVNLDKVAINYDILDLRRKGLKAIGVNERRSKHA